jgi:hypothetical protein
MSVARSRLTLLSLLVLLTACASAEDRLNDGITLQSQGRYIEAVYRYAEAVEKDRELGEAQDRLLASGDSAVMVAMDEADELERRGDPVQAAGLYVTLDQMLARIREVGRHLDVPGDYPTIRRVIFDTAIDWQMVRGDEAAKAGRWDEAQQFYSSSRTGFLPSREQVEESYDAETRVTLQWAAIELEDLRPRSAYEIAQMALEVRSSPDRATTLAVRDLQDQALVEGTIVLAVAPVAADPGVREWLGGEFEMGLDSDLGLDHWTRPPMFVEMADPVTLRNELRGLLRGQGISSPMLLGRAVELIGADLGVMSRLRSIQVTEEDVSRSEHQAIVPRNVRQGARRTTVMDTVTYTTLRGTLVYYIAAEIILVDASGREVNRFTVSSSQAGPFERGEFDGDSEVLALEGDRARYFDPAVIGGQMATIEHAMQEELAVAIAVGTFDQVIAGIR